jgi:hypothetical protein
VVILAELDVLTIVLIGFSSGFGSAFGVECAKVLFSKLKGLKLVRGDSYGKNKKL